MTHVTDNNRDHRYELVIDGHLSVADYHQSDDTLSITHVEVPNELRGRGVAAQLMAGVVADANAKNLKIKPICTYAMSYMQKNPQ